MKYLRKCNMFFCKNTSLLTGGNSTHKTSAGARTGIGRFVKRVLKVPGACQTSYGHFHLPALIAASAHTTVV